jgi:outer membrane protein assembly factor BamA
MECTMSYSRAQRPGIVPITTALGRCVLLVTALALLGASALKAQSAGRRRAFPVPVLGYAPETSLLFGVALVGVASADSAGPATRPSTALLTAVYTLKRQYQLELTLDHWTTGDGWHVTGDATVERYPSEFNGLGAQATDTSEIYTPQRFTLSAGAQRRTMRHVFVGAGYWFRHSRMAETETGGRLAPGTIPGSRGGTEAILTVEGVWDTRDVLYRTRRGGYLRLAYGLAGPALGGDHAYRRYTAEARAYRSIGDLVIAAQAILDATEGTVPFELLPHLGGSGILRGFTVPRFADGAMSAAQLEVRAPLKGLVSVVAFGGAGATAPSVRAIPDARLGIAGGLGLRLLLDRREGLQMRLDYAFARGGGGFYVAAGDAF